MYSMQICFVVADVFPDISWLKGDSEWTMVALLSYMDQT